MDPYMKRCFPEAWERHCNEPALPVGTEVVILGGVSLQGKVVANDGKYYRINVAEHHPDHFTDTISADGHEVVTVLEYDLQCARNDLSVRQANKKYADRALLHAMSRAERANAAVQAAGDALIALEEARYG